MAGGYPRLHRLLHNNSLERTPVFLAYNAIGTFKISLEPILIPSTEAVILNGVFCQLALSNVVSFPMVRDNTPKASDVAVVCSSQIIAPLLSVILIDKMTF